MRKYKKYLLVFLMFTVYFAIVDFLLAAVLGGSIEFSVWRDRVLPVYVFPIFIAIVAWNEARIDRKEWSGLGTLMAGLFALTYLAMVAYLLLRAVLNTPDYTAYYKTHPAVFFVPMLIFAELWMVTKKNAPFEIKKQPWYGAVLYALPYVIAVLMCAHVGLVVSAVLADPSKFVSPWWVAPIKLAYRYVSVIALAIMARQIYKGYMHNIADKEAYAKEVRRRKRRMAEIEEMKRYD